MGDLQTVYCIPIDESGDDIKEDAALTLPLDNIYSKQESTNTMLRMLLNFVGMSVMILITMFGSPYVYKIFIADIISNVEWTDADGKEYDKIGRLKTSEKWAFGIILFTGVLMLGGQDQFGPVTGLFLITLLFIAFARIYFEKKFNSDASNENDFYAKMLNIKENIEDKIDPENFMYPIKVIFTGTKWYEKKEGEDKKESLKWVLICGLYLFILSFSYYYPPSLWPVLIWLPLYLTSFIHSMSPNSSIEDIPEKK